MNLSRSKLNARVDADARHHTSHGRCCGLHGVETIVSVQPATQTSDTGTIFDLPWQYWLVGLGLAVALGTIAYLNMRRHK